ARRRPSRRSQEHLSAAPRRRRSRAQVRRKPLGRGRSSLPTCSGQHGTAPPPMIEPLRLRFDVDCSPTEAFNLWTTRTALWWPASHTLSGRAGTAIIFEPRANGRIYERSPSGDEKDWGTVLHWEPPDRLVYNWYIFSDPEDATEVEVNFRANPDG